MPGQSFARNALRSGPERHQKCEQKIKKYPTKPSLQSLFYAIAEGKGEYENIGGIVIRYSLRLLVDLFRKHIWNDERTANLIAKCCFLKDVKSAVIALKFFVFHPNQNLNQWLIQMTLTIRIHQNSHTKICFVLRTFLEIQIKKAANKTSA